MTLFNLLTAQVLFGLAALLWLWLIALDGATPRGPGVLLAAGRLRGADARERGDVSAIRGRVSSTAKQLVLFLIVPVVVRLARGAARHDDRST